MHWTVRQTALNIAPAHLPVQHFPALKRTANLWLCPCPTPAPTARAISTTLRPHRRCPPSSLVAPAGRATFRERHLRPLCMGRPVLAISHDALQCVVSIIPWDRGRVAHASVLVFDGTALSVLPIAALGLCLDVCFFLHTAECVAPLVAACVHPVRFSHVVQAVLLSMLTCCLSATDPNDILSRRLSFNPSICVSLICVQCTEVCCHAAAAACCSADYTQKHDVPGLVIDGCDVT
jgi:hypothetical protein